MKTNFILIILISSLNLHASFPKKCHKLKKCAKYVSQELGLNFFYPKKFRGKVENVYGTIIDKKDYLNIFDQILANSGYTRIEIGPKNFNIMSTKDVRYHAFKPIYVTAENYKEKITSDLKFYHVEFKEEKKKDLNNFVNESRVFLSRYGRILTRKDKTAAIVDNGKSIIKALSIYYKNRI